MSYRKSFKFVLSPFDCSIVYPPIRFLSSRFSSLLFSICLFLHLFVLFSFQGTIRFAGLSPAWWAQVGSNHRPRAYQARALACWAMSPYRCAYPWFCARPFQTISRLGGDEEIRTLDPLLAGQVLSQLSYTPIGFLSLISRLPEKWRTLHSPLPFGLCQRCAIFPCSLPQSIFATAELNFCVRNGYRWTLCVSSTDLLSLKRKVSKETL